MINRRRESLTSYALFVSQLQAGVYDGGKVVRGSGPVGARDPGVSSRARDCTIVRALTRPRAPNRLTASTPHFLSPAASAPPPVSLQSPSTSPSPSSHPFNDPSLRLFVEMSKDPVAEKSGFLCMYMSNHPDTLVSYVRHYGGVKQKVTSAQMTSIDVNVSINIPRNSGRRLITTGFRP